jgi:hypothetical protein
MSRLPVQLIDHLSNKFIITEIICKLRLFKLFENPPDRLGDLRAEMF